MKKLCAIIIAVAAIASCAKTGPEAQQKLEQSQTVTVKVTPFIGDDTKSTISTAGQFAWTSGDRFGVYPLNSTIGAEQTSQQICFQIQESAVGTNNGLFTGTGWGLVTGGSYKYFAYYPYDKDAEYDNVVVTYPHSYTIAENSSTAHICEDYLVAPVVTPTTSSDATFIFYHMGALVNFKLNIPSDAREATFSYAEISCEDAIFATEGNYDPTEISVSGTPAVVTYPEFNTTSTTNRIVVNLNNCAPDADGNLNLYLMLPPTDLSNKSIRVELQGNNGKAYSKTKIMGTSALLASGKTYNVAFTMEEDANVGIDLSENGTANCYIVSLANRKYKFNCKVRGNGVDPILDDSEGAAITGYNSVQVTWETVNTNSAPETGTVIKDAALDKTNGYVIFSTPQTFVEGNALISIKDSDGNIIWSWHIWATSADLDALAQTYPNNAGVMMDRNLGALSATPGDALTLGFHYQWGRPFPITGGCQFSAPTNTRMATTNSGVWVEEETDVTKGTLAHSAANPTHFIYASASNYLSGTTTVSGNWLWTANDYATAASMPLFWGSAKTMYDPCPVGWKVPAGGSKGVWTIAGFSKETCIWNETEKGWTFTSPAAYYPASGFRGNSNACKDGSLNNVGNICDSWSCSAPDKSTTCYHLFIIGSNVQPEFYFPRAHGFSVRPCQE